MSQPSRVARHTTELMITPEQTWTMITDPAMVALWYAFGGATLDPEPGGLVELRFADPEVFRGRVERVDPPHRFAYRLAQRPALDPEHGNSTLVELTVEPSATQGRSVLSVTETGFDDLDPQFGPFEAYRASQIAWIGAFGLLVQATGIPPAPEPDASADPKT